MFKKLLSLSVLIFSMLLSVFQAEAQSVSIISPIANTTVSGGVPFAIVWTSTGVSGVRFEYSLDGGQRWKWDNNYIGSSPYTTAQVPYYASNPNILIRLVDYYNPANGTTISGIKAKGLGSPKITVSSPSSVGVPVSYNSGNNVYITWNNSYIQQAMPFVNVLLSTNSGVDFPITIAAFNPSSAGSIYPTINFPAGTDNAVIKVEDSYNPANFGLSTSFRILQQAAVAGTVSITSPSDNTTISGCNQAQIYYTGNISDYVNFEYSTNGGTNWTTANTFLWGNTSSNFGFSVPNYAGNMMTRLIRYSTPFTTFAGPSLNVVSNVPVLKFSAPLISAISDRVPNLYVSWNASSACIPQILLQSSVNNGGSWVNLYQGTNTQSYSIPTTVLSGLPTASLLKISDVSNPSNANIIQLVLETPPSLSMSSVVGININCPNASANLKFTKKGMTAIYNFSLQYSTNGGTSWQSINSSFYAYSSPDNIYNWSNVPTSVLGLSNVLVKVTELVTGTSVSGVASIDFTSQLPAPSLGISSPVAQQPTCNTYFKYYGNVCGGVDVYLTTNSGTSLIPVTVNANFLNSYMYVTFPTSYDNGLSYRVIYRSTSNPNASIIGSSFTFTNGFGSVYLSSPLTGGTTGTISLASPQACRNSLVNIDLSTNNGVNFYNLTTNGWNDGSSFNFSIPNISTTGFRVKVTSVSDPTVSILGVASTIDFSGAQKIISITSVNLTTVCGNQSSFIWQKNYANYGYYKIEYSRDGGQYWESINDNLYSSTLGNTTYVQLPNFTTSQLMFRVIDKADPATVGYSSLLNFAPPKPVMTIGAPSNIQAGSVNNYVYFTPTNCVSLVDIFVSTNNGVDFSPLYNRISVSSYFQWQAYNFPVAQAKYKIVSSIDASVSVTSAAFSITGASALQGITFTGVPTGISNCSSPTFGFRHVDFASNSFNIDLTTDNGASWKRVLFLSTYGSPVYAVNGLNIGNLPVNTLLYYRISRSDIPSIVATTSGITITSAGVAGLAFTSPLLNSSIASNALYSITMNSTTAGCILNNIKLEYSLDNGSSFKLINDNYGLASSNSQSIPWYVPSGTNTNTALLRASDVNANSVTVTSATFNIVDPIAVVTVPSVIFQSQAINIPINYAGVSANYYYGFYSLNGGNTWVYTGAYAYLNGSGNTTISFTPPVVGSLTGALFTIANNNTYSSATIKYTSNAFSIDRPLLSTTSPIAGQTVATGSGATTTIAYTFSGWSYTNMYPYYSYDNGLTGNYINSGYGISGSGSNSFTWTLPSITSLTSAMIVWGNSNSWASSTNRYFGDVFSLVPPTNNQITVTGLSDANPCQGKIIAVSFTGFGTFTGGNIFKAEIGFGATPGSGLLVGQLVSTLSSGIVLATIPSGYSGSYNIRVYSSSPYISLSARLISKTLTISSTACITANNNSLLPNIGGVGSITYDLYDMAFQTNTTFNSGNQFIAQISDGNGSFANAINVGTVTGTTAASVGNLIQLFLPTSLQTGSSYRIRVVSTNPVSIGSDNGFGFTLNNAYITVYTVYGNNFCPGSTIPTEFDADGNFNSNNRFLLELTNSGGSIFTSTIGGYADNIGGQYLTVTGIVPQGISSSSSYRTRVSATSPFSQTSAGYESNYFTIQNTCFASINYSSAPFLAGRPFKTVVAPYRPFNSGNAYIIELSDAAGSFSNPMLIGSISGISNVTVNGVIPANTPLGSSYYFRVRSTNHGFTGSGIYLGTINPVGIDVPTNIDNAKVYCSTGKLMMPAFTVTSPVNGDNTYVVQLSNGTSFSSPYNVLTLTSAIAGVVTVPAITLPTNLSTGNYYIRVVSTSPYSVSSNYSNAIYMYNQCVSQPYVGTSLCPGDYGNVGVTAASFNAGNTFSLLLSDDLGNFNSPITLSVITSTGYPSSVNIPFTVPGIIANGSNYKLKVVSSDFAFESATSAGITIKQTCIAAPGGYNSAVSQCSFLPIITVAAVGTVNPANDYKLVLLNNSGFPVATNPATGLTSILGVVSAGNTGVITFTNIILPTVSGTYYLRVDASDPNVTGNGITQLNIANNCIGTPYIPNAKYCAGSTIVIPIYISAGSILNAGNRFVVELSDGSGSFTSPTTVLSRLTTTANFYDNITIPSGIASGTNYKIRIKSTNLVNTSGLSNTFAIDQVCLSIPTLAYGPYIGGSSGISIPVINVGAVNGGNNYSASLYNSNGSLIGSIGTPTSGNTITGTLPTVTNGGYYYVKVTSSNPVASSYNSNYIIVNPTDIKVAPIASSYCVGSTISGITFTVAGSVGGGNQYALDLSDANGYFYYSYNNLASIADNTTGSKTMNAVLPIGISQSPNYKLRIRATNGSISNEVPININATFQWTGANGTDWNNTNNWSCPLIPTPNIDVVIPTVTNYPVINITNAVARNITIDAGANATIASGGLLSIYGDLIVNGTMNSSSLGGVYFTGGYSSNHQILGAGSITLGLVTVPSYNYLSIRHNVTILNNFYNYGYAYNYSTLGVSGTLYNYNRFDAYNTVNVATRFYNDYVFNYYNTYVTNPYFYIGGIFENNSQYFNAGYSNFVFNGNGNQYISGTYNTTFYNIQINNFSNLVLNRGINVCAGYSNAGYFNGLGYDIRFVTAPNNVPTYITSAGYTNFGNVYFENINNVYVNSSIGVQGDFVNIAGFVSGNATLVSFTGSGLQNISATGIYNLTFNGIEVSNTNSELNVDAGLTVKGSFRNRGRFKNSRITIFESNQPQIISGLGNTVFTDFINNNTDIVNGVSVTSNVEIQGHFINNGLFNASGYTITTSGLDVQTISGTDIATFGSIENTNTVGVEVQQDVVVQGSFRNRGRFRSANNTVEFSGTTSQTVVSESITIFNEIINSNTTSGITLEGGYSIGGNITNYGSLDGSLSVITTSGIAVQTISGTEAITLGSVINTNTLGLEATQDLLVMGSFRNSGRFRSADNSVSFDGGVAQVVSGDGQLQLNDVVNNNVTNLQITNTIELTGNIANNGSLDASTSVISTSGTSVQSISGTDISFGTIVNTNILGGVSISAPIEITGDLVNNGALESSSMVSFTGTNQTVSGTVAPLVNDVAITNSADVVVTGTFRTRGRVVNNSSSIGLVAAPSSTVTFEGNEKQSVEGTTPTVFGQVSMTNNAGLDVMQNISTTGISLSGGNLTVDNLKAVSVTSPEPNAVVRTNDSYVSGTLSRVVTASGAAYEFPVGTSDAYRGVAITFAGVNNAGAIAVTPSSTAPVVTQPTASGAPLAVYDPTLGDTLKSILPISWKVEAKNSTIAGSYDIDLQAPLTLPGYTDPNALRVVKRTDDTSPWILAGTPTPVMTVTSTVVRVGRRNVSSFSTFAVAGTCANVSKVLFKPSIDVVGDEFKANFDGNTYQWYIDNVAQSALNSRQIKPLKDGNYQVKVVVSGCASDASDVLSFAGTNTKSDAEATKTDFILYPNPAKDEFTVESVNTNGGVYLVELFDVIGKQIFAKTVTKVDGHVFKLAYNTSSLPSGIYYVKLSAQGKGKVMKLVIE